MSMSVVGLSRQSENVLIGQSRNVLLTWLTLGGLETQGPLLMTQTDRDRLVALKKAKDKKMTLRQAAEELKISERKCGDYW
jgi:hypothetical protein